MFLSDVARVASQQNNRTTRCQQTSATNRMESQEKDKPEFSADHSVYYQNLNYDKTLEQPYEVEI